MKKIIMNENVQLPRTAVVLGNFDGIHKGHCLLIKKAKEIAREEGISTAVFTFQPHPTFVLTNKPPVDLIYDDIEKEYIMDKEGLDYYIILPFSKDVANMSPHQFIEEIILKKLNASVVIIGADYHFGKNRAGNYSMLIEYSKNYDFDVDVIHKLKYLGREVSSTWIREEIKQGNLELANELMGRNFLFRGEVVHGKQLGTKIGFPTANLIPNISKLLPPNGVYLSSIEMDNKTYKAITNIGLKPTVDGESVTVESHILDFNQDIYGKVINVNLQRYLRPEKRFDSIERLKKQISNDIETANR